MKCHVTCCKDCPFFGAVPFLSGLSKILGADTALEKAGTCNYDAEGEHLVNIDLADLRGPKRDELIARARSRMGIVDNTKVPDKCPLRGGDVEITLAPREN